MGGLAHFFEEEGIPTTQISLIRLHTEIIKPPRALWVPFDLGRPLGVPNNPSFQKRVLLAALKLLEAKNGPVLEDFPDEAPISKSGTEAMACPVDFPQPEREFTDREKLCLAFKKEFTSLRPWFDFAVQKRGRSTVGVSRVKVEDLADFLCAFLKGETPDNPRADIALPYTINLATDDLKAFYFEAVTSQPGQESPSGEVLSNWFYDETVAGKVLFTLRDLFKSQSGLMKILGTILIIPAAQINRRKEQAARKE
ncbi:MAG: hypothetical protein HY787_02070 [Deltaproteobacteria bacterium]|nr:hypothetical protein [Deltaproteobacteria bacterium]